jgi:hypothetical protein
MDTSAGRSSAKHFYSLVSEPRRAQRRRRRPWLLAAGSR